MQEIKVVTVDDILVNNKVIQFDIEEYSFYYSKEMSVEVFTDSQEGFEYIKEHGCDILFLDIMMPKMNGFEFLEKLQKLEKKPYTIVVTALGDEETKKRALELGADDFIAKPFDIKEIFTVLNRYFGEEDTSFEDEDFFDFDGDFFDEEESEQMELLNASHHQMTMDEFKIELGREYGQFREEFLDIKKDIEEILDMEGEHLIESIEYIKSVIEKIAKEFAFIGMGFENLAKILTTIASHLDKLQTKSKNELMDIVIYIHSFFKELLEWIENVFVYEDVINVNYANASLYNSLLEIDRRVNSD